MAGRVEKVFEGIIGNVRRQGPGQLCRRSAGKGIGDRGLADTATFCNGTSALVTGPGKAKDFSDLSHGNSLSGHRTLLIKRLRRAGYAFLSYPATMSSNRSDCSGTPVAFMPEQRSLSRRNGGRFRPESAVGGKKQWQARKGMDIVINLVHIET